MVNTIAGYRHHNGSDMAHRIDKRIKKEKRKRESGKRHCVADAWVREFFDSLVCWGQNPDKTGVMMWRIP